MQIALALNVSREAIKWHLKNLYGKFGAGRRKHLLDRAQVLGILDRYMGVEIKVQKTRIEQGWSRSTNP